MTRLIVNDINTHAWRLTFTVRAEQELREEALRNAAKVLHDARRLSRPTPTRY